MLKKKQRAAFTGVSKNKLVILVMISFLFTSYFQSSQSIAISENMKVMESASELNTIKTASIQGKESAKKMVVEQLRAESIEKSLQMLKQEDKKKYFPNKTLVQNKQVEKYIITISDSRDFLISAIDWSLENQIKVLELPTNKDDFSTEERKAMSVAIEKGLLFISSDMLVEKNELGKAIAINKDDFAQKVSEKALIESYSVEKDKVVSRKYNLVDGTSSLDLILMMLSMNSKMNQLQLNNLLEVTSNPIGNIENNEYEVNIPRILEFMLLMKNAPKQSIESNMPSQSLVTTTNTPLPSISASNITTNSITWNVAYMNPNAYGNRLELFNFTTNQWTDISGTYYTKNGSYTASNLLMGNTYRGRLTYLENGVWIVVDKIVTTTATGQPTIQVTNVQSTFAVVNVKYPANVVYGNKLELYHYASGQWTTILSDKAENGNYTINNLIPGNMYFVRMTWYDNGWKIKDANLTTLPNNQLVNIKYEYDSNGRLIYIRDSNNKIIATYIYDDNGNLISVQK